MALCRVIYVLLVLATLVFAQDNTTEENWDSHELPLGRYYSLSTCSYKHEPGYRCLSCSRALHCFPSSFAVLVDCRGLFPYCRDGHCSLSQGSKCFTNDKITTDIPNDVVHDDVMSHDSPMTATKENLMAGNSEISTQESVIFVHENQSAVSEESFPLTEETPATSKESLTLNEKNSDAETISNDVILSEDNINATESTTMLTTQ